METGSTKPIKNRSKSFGQKKFLSEKKITQKVKVIKITNITGKSEH